MKIAIPVVDAIAAAHQKGITHRDLKPANIMVGDGEQHGRVKVLDFGLAKVASAPLVSDGPIRAADGARDRRRSHPGHRRVHVTGTSGRQSGPTRVRIQFSLGVILYEMGTGQRPFAGETSISIISAIVKDTPRSVIDLNPALPRDFGRIVKRALVKDPERRYQTAKDLRNDLARIAVVSRLG